MLVSIPAPWLDNDVLPWNKGWKLFDMSFISKSWGLTSNGWTNAMTPTIWYFTHAQIINYGTHTISIRIHTYQRWKANPLNTPPRVLDSRPRNLDLVGLFILGGSYGEYYMILYEVDSRIDSLSGPQKNNWCTICFDPWAALFKAMPSSSESAVFVSGVSTYLPCFLLYTTYGKCPIYLILLGRSW